MTHERPYPILYILSGNLGGITSGLVELLTHLNRKQFQPWIALLNEGGDSALFKRFNTPCVRLPSKGRIQFLQTLISREKIQLVQSCDAVHGTLQPGFRLNAPASGLHRHRQGGTLR